jgi:MFS family permease
LLFVVALGTVSLFADMTYEGARSINGAFLDWLGASATVVGVVAGLGELVGYGFRLCSGWLGDRTERYWTITIAGYVLNLFAVPLLALAGNWWIAAVLIVIERAGRAIRSPVRDAMLSHAASRTGLGWGFGLHEAMDQTGAVIGPLLVAWTLASGANYTTAFGLLLVPAIVSIGLVFTARLLFPRPRDFDLAPATLTGIHFGRAFRLYVLAIALIGAGYADFALVSFHFGKTDVIGTAAIPVYYAIAMAVEGGAALLLGHLFDRHGFLVLLVGLAAGAVSAPLIFLGGPILAMVGMILWGVGMGAQESVVKSAAAAMTPAHRRATAFGILNGAVGVLWFLGSVALGILYDRSILGVAVLSCGLQLAATPFLLASMKLRGIEGVRL